MRVRKLSPTGDFVFGSGALDFYVNTPQAVAQVVQTSLLLWLGEWYLDTALGMQWIQGVLGKHSQATADVTIQDYILGIDGVVDVTNFASTDDQDARRYAASLVLDTVYGQTPLQIANQTLF